MRTDSVVKADGMNILLEGLGKVDAERFITLILREPFDYTKWQEDLFSDLSVRELSTLAEKHTSDQERSS